MIDFYYWPTPNGWKVAIMLEECGLEYRVVPVNIGKGDQFKPEFLAISPNNRMPAIIDHDYPEGPMPVFESGAILIHLAEKAGRFMPQSRRGRKETLEWLFWQVGNLGPMAGQLSHFVNYAQGEHPYSHKRYADEYNRCLGVLERRLEGREFILDEYSIADMASWPWVLIAKPLGQPLDDFPNVSRWRAAIRDRPACRRVSISARNGGAGRRPRTRSARSCSTRPPGAAPARGWAGGAASLMRAISIQLWAQIVLFILSVFEVGIAALAGQLRRRLGWTSATGQLLWLMLIFLGAGAVWLGKQLVYWKITSSSPFDDIIAWIIIIGGSLGGTGIVFYYAIKYSK